MRSLVPTPCFEALVARIKEMQSSHDADDSAVNVPGLEIRKVSATATSLVTTIRPPHSQRRVGLAVS